MADELVVTVRATAIGPVVAMNEIIFPPGWTRSDLEPQLAHENQVGLWLCGGLAALGLLSLFLGETHFAVTFLILLAILGIGGQWEHGRRRGRFTLWEIEQRRLAEEE